MLEIVKPATKFVFVDPSCHFDCVDSVLILHSNMESSETVAQVKDTVAETLPIFVHLDQRGIDTVQPVVHTAKTTINDVEPGVHTAKTTVNVVQTTVNDVETTVNDVETTVNVVETTINVVEPGRDIKS